MFEEDFIYDWIYVSTIIDAIQSDLSIKLSIFICLLFSEQYNTYFFFFFVKRKAIFLNPQKRRHSNNHGCKSILMNLRLHMNKHPFVHTPGKMQCVSKQHDVFPMLIHSARITWRVLLTKRLGIWFGQIKPKTGKFCDGKERKKKKKNSYPENESVVCLWRIYRFPGGGKIEIIIKKNEKEEKQ